MKPTFRPRAALAVCVLALAVFAASRPAHGQPIGQPLRDRAYQPALEPVLGPGFARRLVYDLGAQASYPLGLARREPSRFLLGTLGISALMLTDAATYNALATPSWIRHDRMVGPARTLSQLGDGTSALALVAGFGLVGFVGGSEREKQTTMMLTEAVATSFLWTGALKLLGGRERPRDAQEPNGDWTGPGTVFNDDGARKLHVSFPSGHSTGAWAAATILAHQYPSHHIVPIAAYGTATAISYSRMVVGAHWLSDVVVGGLIGYGCARQIIGAHGQSDEPSRIHVLYEPNGDEQHLGLSIAF